MHLGLPMKVLWSNGVTATVARQGHSRCVSLLDVQPERGTVVLVHLGAVVCSLTDDEQRAIEVELAELDPDVELHHLALTEALE